MFRNSTPPDSGQQAPATNVAPELIPLSYLVLDLPAPELGWAAYLTGRGVDVVTDDVGRLSIARADVRMLVSEQRENEARQAEMRAAMEQQAIEADQRFRASLPRGLPWHEIGDGGRPVAALLEAARSEDPRRRSMDEDLDAPGGGAVFHSFQDEE